MSAKKILAIFLGGLVIGLVVYVELKTGYSRKDLTKIHNRYNYFFSRDFFGLQSYWLRVGAENGDLQYQYLLGNDLLSSRDVNQREEGLAWLIKSAVYGYSGAQQALGDRFSNGNGVEQNLNVARAWYSMAAYQGDSVAMYELALIYSKLGNPNNLLEAYAWAGLVPQYSEHPKSLYIERANELRTSIENKTEAGKLTQLKVDAKLLSTDIRSRIRPRR